MRGPRFVRKWRRRRRCINKYGKGNCPHLERHSPGGRAVDRETAATWALAQSDETTP